MASIEAGSGEPIVFLHGNPTSSYLWRNVVPHVADLGHCIVPDLIGMGDSDKVPNLDYRFVEHRRYLDAFFEAVGVQDRLTLVVHDWGSALGFDWANRHRTAAQGVCYMEAIVRPISWADWPEASRPIFQAMRSPAGEDIVLQKNVFVERILPGSILRTFTDDEMNEYRRPFRNPGEDRRPTLAWPRELPIDGTPEDVVAMALLNRALAYSRAHDDDKAGDDLDRVLRMDGASKQVQEAAHEKLHRMKRRVAGPNHT